MKHFILHIISCFFFFELGAKAQEFETVRISNDKVTSDAYLRFDKTIIDYEPFKKASTKSVILHDMKGNLWLKYGQNAKMIRYDGNYSKPFDGSNWQLYQTDKGEIFGSNDKGFVRYDNKTDSFIKYRNPILSNQRIDWNIYDKTGKVWYYVLDKKYIGNMPFFCFDFLKKTFTKYHPKHVKNAYSKGSELMEYEGFTPAAVTHDGRVWGIIKTHKKPDYFGSFDPKTGQCLSFPLAITFPDLFANREDPFSFLNNMYFDGKYIWMGHAFFQAGLLRFDIQTYQWKQFLFSEYAQNRIQQITANNEDELLIRSAEGLMFYNKKNRTAKYYKNDASDNFSFDAKAGGFHKDQMGNLWFGIVNADNAVNENAVSFLMPKKQYFKPANLIKEKFDAFRMLVKTNKKMIYSYWKVGGIKIIEQNLSSKTNKIIWNHDFEQAGFEDIIGCINDTINNKTWVFGVTKIGGVLQIDEKSKKLISVKGKVKGLPNEINNIESILSVRAYCQDKAGNVWFASNDNLYKFNTLTKQFEGYDKDKIGLGGSEIKSIMADNKGIIWIGSRNGDMVWFNPKTQKTTPQEEMKIESDGDLNKIVEDKQRNVVWISKADGGLWKYEVKTRKYIKIHEVPSLYNMYLTKDGIMWIRSSQNIIRYEPDTRKIVKYGAEYGFTNFDWIPFTKTKEDDFYFKKFKFNDRDICPDTTKPKAVFSYLKVFDKIIGTNESLNDTKSIELDYNQNFFGIGFSLLSFFQKELNQYAYKLDGFNKNWINLETRPEATFTNVPPGEYTLKIKGANNDNIWSEEKHLTIIIKPAFWQTWWFKALILCLFLIIIYKIYQYNLNQRNLKNKLKIEELTRKQRETELQQKIAETEISALRSQMNPHFIFNCLNSIKLYSLENDSQAASDYLTKFSRLIRMVLENSRSEKVTLENELEALELYIEMEAMRFKDKVKYQISIAKNIDPQFVEIPPLLIQPFVENSIWHGLMHNTEGGLVKIDVSHPNDNMLHIEISDNGIGREKAMEYKSKSAMKNKSLGMKVTSERIELINQIYKTNTEVKIIDLKDSNGNALGTKVILNIPI